MKLSILLFIPVFYFNYSSSNAQIASGKEITLILNCNMEFDIISGRFDPNEDTLKVLGSFNHWEKHDKLTVSDLDTNIYTVVKRVSVLPNSRIFYFYYYQDSLKLMRQSYHLYTFCLSNEILGQDSVEINKYYSYAGNGDISLPNSIIQIKVDLNNAKDKLGNSFFNVESVAMIGPAPFLSLPEEGWPDSNGDSLFYLNDSGIIGDEVVGDGIWSSFLHLQREYLYHNTVYRYTVNYGLETNNGTNNNETLLSTDHHFYIPSNYNITDSLFATVRDTFGVMGKSELKNVVITKVENKIKNYNYDFKLYNNYPNPFNPSTKIKYTIPTVETHSDATVQLKIYDVLGREVEILVNKEQIPGNYEVKFNVSKLSSGVYFYKLQVGKFSDVKKMVLMR